jgi:hypothetical protein
MFKQIMNWDLIITWGKNILIVIGGITVFFTFIKGLSDVIPQLRKFKSWFWSQTAERLKNRTLVKNAIASDIETHVNEVVADLQKELPLGWIRKASIEWVTESKENDLEEGEIILRVKPFEDQDQNFLAGVYTFFSKALFPHTKEVIPTNVRKAAILRISHRTISNKKPYLRESFENSFLETAIKEDPTIATYLGRYENLDKKGFFTGSFLREIHEIATKTRFTDLRNRMNQEVDEILTHIEGFISQLGVRPTRKIPQGGWYRIGPATSYAFMLVARPEHGGVEPYVNRAKERLTQNIERLYIMGAKEEKPFAKYVISEIAKLPNYKLVEVFELNKDYRGNTGGIGALFVTSQAAVPEETSEI